MKMGSIVPLGLAIAVAIAWTGTVMRANSSAVNPGSTADWKTFTHKKPTFALKYPPNWTINGHRNSVSVDIQRVSTLNGDTGDDPQDALMRERMLAVGRLAGSAHELNVPEEASKKVIIFSNGLRACDQTLLDETDSGDVDFIRETYFYRDGYQIDITAQPAGDMSRVIPGRYLRPERLNSTQMDYVWEHNGPTRFYQDISHHRVGGPLQRWFDEYDLMVKTISIGR